MENNKFYNLLTQALDIPFDIEDVADVDENCGTVWIELNNGDVYSLSFMKTENDD